MCWEGIGGANFYRVSLNGAPPTNRRAFNSPLNEGYFLGEGDLSVFSFSVDPLNHKGETAQERLAIVANYRLESPGTCEPQYAVPIRSRSSTSPSPEPERDSGSFNQETIAHNKQVITEQGYKVTLPHGLETIAFKALKPDDCGAIGNQAVCDMDVLQVADISGWAEQGIRFCFKGYGKVLFLPSHDASGMHIDQKTAAPEELPVEVDGEHVCVTINRDGKLFLVEGEPLVLHTQSIQPVPVWEPVPVTQCGHTIQPDGSLVHVVQSGHHCWAIAEACGIHMEDIQRLNPGFGDCRMLHPGDELVVSAPPSPTLTTQAVPTPLPPAEPLSPQDPDIVAELPRYQQDEESASASAGAQLACGAWLSLGAAGHVDGTARAHLLGTVTSESWTALETVYGMYIKQKLETGENLTDEEVAALVEMDAIPLGVCGALGFAVDELERARRGENRFDHLLEQAGIDTEREDPYARRDTSCELDLNRTVGIYNWPAKDSDPVGKLNAREEMPVFGTVQIPGERPYYIIRVKVSGSRLLPDFAENLRNGTGFVPVEFVDVTGTGCQRLPDWSSVLRESFVVKPTTSNEIRPIVFDLSDHGGEECFVKTLSANTLLLCHDMYETSNSDPSCSLTPQGGRFNVEKYTDDGRIYLRMSELNLESGWAPILRGELYDEDSGTFKQGTSLSFVTGSNLDCLPKF